MAVSKNNRRKKHKRTQNHSAPVTTQREIEEQRANEEKLAQNKKHLKASMCAMLVIVVGLVLAFMGNRFIGYPITFIGGVADLIIAVKQGKGKKLTVTSFAIYCILVAYMWISEFLVG